MPFAALAADTVLVPAGSSDALADAIAAAGPHGTVVLEAGLHTESGPVTIGIPVSIIGEEGAVLEVATVPDDTPPCRRGWTPGGWLLALRASARPFALMDHPNIARILDCGATQSGRPYFVMDLVRGVPITEFCDRNQLSTKERLGLFIDVCAAVQHAHQKGIIHRDLKPSNVLVTMNDDRPMPKIIDFGIAKATAGKLTDQTLFTQFHQFVGTPAYMSPEQAMSAMDVDN